MHGQGKPVFGYTNVAGDLSARVSIDGFEIEEFGFHDNLMCEGPVWHSGGSVVRRETSLNDLFTDLGAFEECLRRVPRPAGA
jgi:nucleoside 2-deoxyribosyltransferase